MTTKKIIQLDMDGVIVDLQRCIDDHIKDNPNLATEYADRFDCIPGIFENSKPIKDSIESILKLHNSNKYDLYIATSAPWDNDDSPTHKKRWIENHFGTLFHKKMIITHCKHLLLGDYLIDDRLVNGAAEFAGEHIHFGTPKYSDWNTILKYLLDEN